MIFTDGSKKWTYGSCSVNPTMCTVELLAIILGLQWVDECNTQHVSVASDSLALTRLNQRNHAGLKC